MESFSLHQSHGSFQEVISPITVLKRHASILVTLLFFYAVIIILLSISLKMSGGNLSYSLDDTFIHMAIAKHLVVNGVWGVTPYEFSSSSSSPLYTLLLAASFYCFGPNMLAPLILNILLSTFLLFLIEDLLVKQNLSFGEKVLSLMAFVFFMPLPILTVMGMEHVLHTLMSIWFAYLATKILSKETVDRTSYIKLLLVAILLTSSRYEGLFIIIPVCVLFFFRKKFLTGLLLGFAAILPLMIYGIISLKAGSYWLPNSVLLKGQEVSFLSFDGIRNLYERPLLILSQAPWLFSISIFVFTLGVIRHYALKLSIWNTGQLMILIFLTAVLFHLEFARVGWAYRYEAYLMALGILVLAMHSKETLAVIYERLNLQQRLVAGSLIMIMTIPIAARGAVSLIKSPVASKNIYEQQFQMGRFLKIHYNRQSVLAADIGAINFLADLACLDFIGLGSIEIAKARREGRFDQAFVKNIVDQKGIRIAVVYDYEFIQNQSGWKKVAEWKISDNKVAASDNVSFYAIHENEVEPLLSNLRSFERELPPTVKVSYY
ncbi:MAG TPA: hypothetical protein VL443_16940 [Cyclobacteriaceae bacterium]|nr:hypothetical protein [Cyclobacteriaceae bacterium]